MKPILFLTVAVCAWGQSPAINDLPSREFGQPKLQSTTSSAPNLVEGRELNGPFSLAFDTSVSPPILYVADTNNNRVLAWQNPAALTKGNPADKVIGQRDMFSTQPQGPGSLSSGLKSPTGVAVDRNGGLYVVDTGNNRILRYPAPFRQTGDLLPVDLVIGQRTISSGNSANEGQNRPSEKTLYFSDGSSAFVAGITLDSQGNLWVADAGNNRVLRFPVASLVPNTIEPAADMVLGQSGFGSGTLPPEPVDPNQQGLRNKAVVDQPSGLAFDQSGRLYVVDRRARALFFAQPAPGFLGASATRVLGIPPTPAQGQRVSFPNDYSLGAFTPQGVLTGTSLSVVTSGDNIFVCDTNTHRIVRFGSPDTWPAETLARPSPPILSNPPLGQPDLTSGKPNRGLTSPDATSLNLPAAAAFLGAELWVADTGNNRVVSFPPTGSGFAFLAASRVLGQLDFFYGSPNLVEGRELWLLNGNSAGGAVVVDQTSNPPHLYIADTFNNRVLGFRDARAVGVDARGITTKPPDLVIGQPDLFRTTINYPSGDKDLPTPTGLYGPAGLAVDANGNLLVADSGNGRVLRFPAPFSQFSVPPRADLVLGQRDFTSPSVKDPSSANLNTPFGLALLNVDGSLVVSDLAHNRIVLFRRPRGGDFSANQQAALVLGQPDFASSAFGSGLNQLRGPRHIAVDTSDRLYVCDSGNDRLLIFSSVSSLANGATAAFQLGSLGLPSGVAVSALTGEIWLAATNGRTVFRLKPYPDIQFDANPTARLVSSNPLAVALDALDNLVVAEAANRVAFYYAKLTFQHAASYNQQPLAPGQLAYLYRLGQDFSLSPADGTIFSPWPATLGDLQVLVAGVPAPIAEILPSRIDFQVPMNAPSSGSADFVVQRASTGEILAAATLLMQQSNPGFFTLSQTGSGQAAAVNEDGTVNGQSNPVGRGHIISFYLTGQGFVNNAPPDGLGPPGPVSTTVKPIIFSTASVTPLDPKYVDYSGLAPFLPGKWQLNFRVPEQFPPGNVTIALTMNDFPSNIGPGGGRIAVTFWVK